MKYRAISSPCIRVLALSIVIILNLVLFVPLFGGCGGTASNTFLELLNLVPEDYAVSGADYPVYFTLTDYASYYQDFDITFTNFEELTEKIRTNNIRVLVGGSDITGWGSYAELSTIQDEYVGYNIADVDAEIQFGIPPADCVAAIGRFDPQATRDAFKNQSEWPSWAISDYATEDYRGVTIHSWGSGFETHITTRLCPPHIDRLGRARPLAVTDRYLFYAASTEVIKVIIDASQNKYQSLADLPEYAAIANGLADLRAYTAMVGEGSLANKLPTYLESVSELTPEEQVEFFEKSIGPRLKKFLTFGTGLGSDEKGTYTAIVLYHENHDNALENVSLLKQRIESVKSFVSNELWSTRITDTDIKVKGNVLLAKLYTTSISFWESWFSSQDNLLAHEE